jgi:Ser/Thr protein kinase RdoA (MazF antagonist)
MLEAETAQLRDLLASQGVSCERLTSLSLPGRGRKRGRRALRVDTREGRVLKVRLFESAAAAADLAALRASVDAPFLPPIERRGPLLLEPWIEGESLSPEQAEARAGELGALLGRLHAARPAGAREQVSTRDRRERARTDLASLVLADALDEGAAASLEGELLRGDPGRASAALVHFDFCPENLVVDPAGELHVIDNEWLSVDAAGIDLGRTWSRWPVSDAAWQRFQQGYARTAPEAPAALRFWLIAMAARGAGIRLEGPSEGLALPLARLGELASGRTP